MGKPECTEFDLAVIGAGIIGLMCARRAHELWEDWRILIIDRAFGFCGSTHYSIGLDVPYGTTAERVSMSAISQAYYSTLDETTLAAPTTRSSLYCVCKSTDLERERERFIGVTPRTASVDDVRQLRAAFPGLNLGKDRSVLAGATCRCTDVAWLAALMLEKLRSSSKISFSDGTEIVAAVGTDSGVLLRTSDGREMASRYAIAAPGPWVTDGLTSDVASAKRIRVKKVAALHVDKVPNGNEPVLFFLDEDAFLMPMAGLRYWIFSYTCNTWDVSASGLPLSLTKAERQSGLAVLGSYLPSWPAKVTGARVFCDAYGEDWNPVITSFKDSRITLATGGSGSGYRLAPGIAEKALRITVERSEDQTSRAAEERQ